MEFKTKSISKKNEVLGTMTLYVDDKAVGDADFRTPERPLRARRRAAAIGYDSGNRVSAEYSSKFAFSGGQIIKVVYDIADDVYVDMERELVAALARD